RRRDPACARSPSGSRRRRRAGRSSSGCSGPGCATALAGHDPSWSISLCGHRALRQHHQSLDWLDLVLVLSTCSGSSAAGGGSGSTGSPPAPGLSRLLAILERDLVAPAVRSAAVEGGDASASPSTPPSVKPGKG